MEVNFDTLQQYADICDSIIDIDLEIEELSELAYDLGLKKDVLTKVEIEKPVIEEVEQEETQVTSWSFNPLEGLSIPKSKVIDTIELKLCNKEMLYLIAAIVNIKQLKKEEYKNQLKSLGLTLKQKQ